MKLFVAVPTVGSIVDSQAYSLRAIEAAYKGRIELVYPQLCVRRMFHDYARNALVGEFLSTDCDAIWFLDSDVTPPSNVLDILIDGTSWEAAGAPYPVFMTPAGQDHPQVVFTLYQGEHMHPASVPMSGKGFVDGMGTGCMFLRRSVFEKVAEPYFDFTYEPSSRRMLEGEDLRFCRKLHSNAVKFYVDFGAVCRHQKSIDLTDVNNYAITFSNRNVLAYDAMIKEKVGAAVRAAYSQGFNDASAKSRSNLVLPGEF